MASSLPYDDVALNDHSTPVSAFFVAGILVAVLWVAAALPDLVDTFVGNRTSNETSIAPLWLKGLRDIATLLPFLLAARQTSFSGAAIRLVAVAITLFFIGLSYSRGIELSIGVRGTLWISLYVWCATAIGESIDNLKDTIRGLSVILIPSSIFASLVIGLFGKSFYFEGIGFYQRNPGIFLTPSATAFMACAIYLIAPKNTWVRAASLFAGILTISGVFFLNVFLFFGRLSRIYYIAAFISAFLVISIIGLETAVETLSSLSSIVRSGDATSVTLLTRALIFNESIREFDLLGRFPIGLNIAVNQEIGGFFPDNAFLALFVAYGGFGVAFIGYMLYKCASCKNAGGLVLLVVGGMFYVWFENLLFAAVAGILGNSIYFSDDGDSVDQ